MKFTPAALAAALISTTLSATMAAILILGLAHERANAATTVSLTLPTPHATFRSGSLLVQQFGSGGKNIVLIPGLSSGPWEFATMIRTLARNNTVYALTLPGFDGTAAIASPYLPHVTDDFWALLQSHHIQKPVIIGHSLGGTLAYLLAEQHAHRLQGIVSIDGLPVFPGTESFTATMRAQRAKMMLGMFANLTSAQCAASNARYMASIGTSDPRLAERLATAADRSDPKAMAEFASEDLALDLRPQLSAITIPVLLISPYFPADFSTPPMKFSASQKAAYYALLTPGIAHEKVVSISPARHYAQLDQPQETQDAIDAFLTSLPK